MIRAMKNGTTLWTPEEDTILKENFGTHSAGFISRNLMGSKRGTSAIRARAARLGLEKPSKDMLYKCLDRGDFGRESKPTHPRRKDRPVPNSYIGLPPICWPTTHQGCGHIMRICQDSKKDILMTEDARKFFLTLAQCLNVLGPRLEQVQA